jgi:Stage II sporulation protein E (SpoIIE)
MGARNRVGGLVRLLSCFFAIIWATLGGSAQQGVVLGHSAVELTGPWKFHAGDDMRWAQSSFDDSGWGTMDLTPPEGSKSPFDGSPGFVPGWTAKGYASYSGYAWYRLHIPVQVEPRGPVKLGIKMPGDFDDAYELYVNGSAVGSFGDFNSTGVVSYNSVSRSFYLPDGLDLRQPLTLAIRTYMPAWTLFSDQDPGGLHGPPELGEQSTIQALDAVDWFIETRALTPNAVQSAIVLLVLIAAFVLYSLDRDEPAYLWLGLTLTALFLSRTVTDSAHIWPWLSLDHTIFFSRIAESFVFVGWALFWGYWFHLGGMRSLHRILWPMGILLGIAGCLFQSSLVGWIFPATASDWLISLAFTLKTAFNVILLWFTYRGIRKDHVEGLLALPAVLLRVFAVYSDRLIVLHIPVVVVLHGYGITLNQISAVLMIVIVTLLLLRRFLQAQRRQEKLKQELEATRTVQQVLIPERIPEVPGFRIASVYKPAGLVGGDFFQIFPTAGGSVLIIIGDVSGKGIPAAMTVSLLVGTFRTLATYTQSPGEILAAMNQRMIGRTNGGFTTCLVLRATPDGAVALANAGHISPYLDSKELEVENGLPLGLAEQTSYQETNFHLERDKQLTLVTDGVVEARSRTGELFGFDRTQSISMNSAESIADSAQSFGQDDDITVLTLKRISM